MSDEALIAFEGTMDTIKPRQPCSLFVSRGRRLLTDESTLGELLCLTSYPTSYSPTSDYIVTTLASPSYSTLSWLLCHIRLQPDTVPELG
jgi:hypothetical protein